MLIALITYLMGQFKMKKNLYQWKSPSKMHQNLTFVLLKQEDNSLKSIKKNNWKLWQMHNSWYCQSFRQIGVAGATWSPKDVYQIDIVNIDRWPKTGTGQNAKQLL